MNYETIELQRDSLGMATLWLNRPEKNNAFNAQVIDELHKALDEIKADSAVRLVCLRGRGKHFSAGADLLWMQQSAELDLEANQQDAQLLGELMFKLYSLPQPTFAVVQGAAFGGALGLISCCDMAIGSEDALFSLSEVRIGLAPAVISPFVVKAIGERVTRRYALTAERFTGYRARELGLLSECYHIDELPKAAEAWAAMLLMNGPKAMQACKVLLNEVGNGVLSPEVRRYTEAAIAQIRVSPEGQEGLQAFLEKRKPSWQENQQ